MQVVGLPWDSREYFKGVKVNQFRGVARKEKEKIWDFGIRFGIRIRRF